MGLACFCNGLALNGLGGLWRSIISNYRIEFHKEMAWIYTGFCSLVLGRGSGVCGTMYAWCFVFWSGAVILLSGAVIPNC